MPAWPVRAGLLGSYLFAFFALLGITPATVGLVLSTAAFLWDFRGWRPLVHEPLIRACLVFSLYVAAHTLVVYLTAADDALASAAIDAGTDWLKVLLFVPFAYWMAGDRRRIEWVLMLSLAGFIVGSLRSIDWTGFDASFFQTRIQTQLPTITFGMFTAIGLLGLVAMRSAFWGSTRPALPRWIRIAVWLLLLGLLLEGLYLSLSRATWIAFAVAILVLGAMEWRARRHAVSRKALILSGLITALALGGFALLQGEQIGNRLLEEQTSAVRLLRGEWSEVESDSIGLRARALRFAAHLIHERPWLGWGAGSSRYLLEHSNRPELIDPNAEGRTWLVHLHNAYAEVLVQLGVVGLVLTAMIVVLLARVAAQACRTGDAPGDLCRLLLAILVFSLIWNLGSFRVVRHDGLFFWVVFAGIAYSHRLRAVGQASRATS